jgi:hypothetical protein
MGLFGLVPGDAGVPAELVGFVGRSGVPVAAEGYAGAAVAALGVPTARAAAVVPLAMSRPRRETEVVTMTPQIGFGGRQEIRDPVTSPLL